MKPQPKIWLLIFGLFSILIAGCFPYVERFNDDENNYEECEETITIIEYEPVLIQPIIIIEKPYEDPKIKHRNPPIQRDSNTISRTPNNNNGNRNGSSRDSNTEIRKDNSRKRGARN